VCFGQEDTDCNVGLVYIGSITIVDICITCFRFILKQAFDFTFFLKTIHENQMIIIHLNLHQKKLELEERVQTVYHRTTLKMVQH